MARGAPLAWDDWIHTISLTREVDEEYEHCRDTTMRMVEAAECISGEPAAVAAVPRWLSAARA